MIQYRLKEYLGGFGSSPSISNRVHAVESANFPSKVNLEEQFAVGGLRNEANLTGIMEMNSKQDYDHFLEGYYPPPAWN